MSRRGINRHPSEPVMEFRTVPPDPAEFPWWQMLWAPVLPALPIAILGLGELLGHQWTVHGGGRFILGLSFALSVLWALVWSAVMLASAVPALREHPTLRTRRNIVCTGVAAVGAVVSGAFIVAGIYAIAVSPEYWTNA